MNILDWFDPENIEHLKAYKYLQDTGVWPKGFLPEDVDNIFISALEPNILTVWRSHLANRLADRYIEQKLDEPYYEDYSYYVGDKITCGRMPLKYGSWIAAGRPA